jgi:DNA-binding NarL/FixJ family response regulator
MVKIFLYEKDQPEELVNSFIKRYKITNKEKEIILLVKDGLFNKEIAHNLGITEGTVKIHIYNIYRKTGANSRVELVNLISS